MRAPLAWSCLLWTPMRGSRWPSSSWREEQVRFLAKFLPRIAYRTRLQREDSGIMRRRWCCEQA